MNNTNDQLKKIFEEAAKSIESLPENIQPKAFEIAVSQLLKTELPLQNEPAQDYTSQSQIGKTSKDSRNILQKISKEVGIDESAIKTVYRLGKDNNLKVIVPLNGGNAEKQRYLAYLYLFAMKVGLNKEWVGALDFAQMVNDYGANDGHISDTLADEKEIRQSGKRRGKEYTLTPNGLAKARDLIKTLIGVKNEEVE